MRKSKLLKIISYCLIPILVLIIGLSVFYQLEKDIYDDKINISTYLKTDTFLNLYMNELSSNAEILIYHNNRYNNCIYDGDIRICYVDGQNFHFFDFGQYYLKDYYFLIQYRNLALTNVELTTQTDNIESIKNYINNGSKKTNIINGQIDSNSEIFSQKAIQYFDDFENTYYSINKNNSNQYVVKQEDDKVRLITEDGEFEYNPYDCEYIVTDDGVVITPIEESQKFSNAVEQSEKEWYTTSIKDFEIYASYSEDFVEVYDRFYYKMLINDLKPYEEFMIYAIPIASILLMIIIIYLIVSIGYSKDKEGIDFNDLDKIPIEIIIFGAFLIVGCVVLIISSLSNIDENNYVFANSLFLTCYMILYVVCAVLGVTIIKRIKAKKLIRESLIAKICIWFYKIFKKVWNKIKNCVKSIYTKIKTTIKEMTENWPKIIKLVIFVSLYMLLGAILIWVMGFIGLVVELLIGLVIAYFFIEDFNCYTKIEKHLKEMCEGKNTEKLDESKFTKNFKEIVKNINDISKGFENAREEGIKSERLKTELITNVSHDIKTPLTSIINYVDLLKKENIENEKAKEYIEVLDNKSQRLKKLTEDLVEASKASSGNVKLNTEKLNIVELIKQSTGEFEDKFKTKELEIITEYTEDEIYINADNRYMYRIIENLFSNINKYAQEKSRVYIDIRRNETKAIINIKNISKERLNISSDELMQRFVRGDKSRTTEGSGLGLSISKSLTELQKGKFEIKIDGDLFKVELEFDII